jgi:hypothetical protein
MKELDIRIRNGGDDAIAAACELAGLAKERRGYEDVMNATEDMTDIVVVLRGVGFSAVSPQAGDLGSLLHYCVTHAADEIERLRSQPCPHVTGTVTQHCTLTPFTLTDAEREAVDRVRIAFRDMDHNDMTMQQIEDYEAICDLLERTK